MDSQEIMDSQKIIDSQEIMDSQEIIDFEDITDSEDIIDSDILDSNEDFIIPSKNFGIHWSGFLHSKELKNNKARRYNAKCTYCGQIFEARKEAITNHILNICRKIPAENRIFYSQTNKNKIEQVTEISTHKVVLVTDYFDKATMLPEKASALHILLLQALVYGNVPFSFIKNPFFVLFLNNLRSSYNTLLKYTLSNSIIQTKYAQILVEMVDQINEIYTNKIINIEDFSSIRHTADNLLVAVETSLQNVSINFDKIIAIVMD
ncbi:33934_t:CDS:2, partial [Gigaspora margarita]